MTREEALFSIQVTRAAWMAFRLFRHLPGCQTMEISDLLQIGRLGLLTAKQDALPEGLIHTIAYRKMIDAYREQCFFTRDELREVFAGGSFPFLVWSSYDFSVQEQKHNSSSFSWREHGHSFCEGEDILESNPGK